jgi:hypothetical protein
MKIELFLLRCNIPLKNNICSILYYHPTQVGGYIEEISGVLKFYKLTNEAVNKDKFDSFYYGVDKCVGQVVKFIPEYIAELTFIEEVDLKLEINYLWLEIKDRYLARYKVKSYINEKNRNKVYLNFINDMGADYV